MAGGRDDITALVLCEHREDRKVLFDVLEPLELGSVHTARTVEQAEQFLAQLSVNLLILELGFEPDRVNRLLDEYFASPDGVILAVLPPPSAQSGWSWDFLPPRVGECLSSPIDPGEAAYRIARILSDLAPGAREEAAGEERELLLDGTDDEYVFSDPRTGQIREVNRAFLEAAGGDEAGWVGQDLSMIGLQEPEEERTVRQRQLRQDGEVTFECLRRRESGQQDHVRVWQRLGVRDGRLVYLTRLRAISGERRLGEALEQLAALASQQPSAETSGQIAALVSSVLELDFFVIQLRDAEGELLPLVAHGRGEGGAILADREAHRPYASVLAGDPVIAHEHAAALLGGDPFIDAEKIEAYLGLPIRSRGGEVIGAIIGAWRRPLLDGRTPVALFEALAGLQSLWWDAKRLRAESETHGLHDALTKLPNRMLFNDRLALALQEARRSGEMLAMMFVDLDRFKTINDSLGHAVGDQVLEAVSERLSRSVRSSDTVARYAGDEFTILLRHIVQKDDVMRVAQKINRLLAEPLPVRGSDELQITASIGVSFFPDDGATPEELLRHADMAMYNAKGMGRNTSQNYVEKADESQQQKLVLESKLRHAEAKGELRIYYQPQVDTGTEDIVGMEALIRWEHPELGLISPGFFIPLAEETGLIVPIGEWLLRKAVIETKDWQERFELPLVLGVNLSPLQLKQPNLVSVVESALNDSGLEAKYLDLEVTESISIKSIPGLRERLGQLRELGCSISIDDFGTGQSSLDYLKRFPADRIKVDQSFVRNIGVDPDDEAIVKATISMAHSLKLGVIAEGVEEEDHLDFLRRNDCDECQGYLFCRPLPADSFSRLLVEREALTSGAAPTEVGG